MAEIVGVIASAIALVQGFHGARKIYKAVKSVKEIVNECTSLRDELNNLVDHYGRIWKTVVCLQNVGADFPADLETRIKNSREQVQAILDAIQKLYSEVEGVSSSSTSTKPGIQEKGIKYVRWLRKKGELQALVQKTRDVCKGLQTIGTDLILLYVEFSAPMMMGIHQNTTAILATIQQTPQSPPYDNDSQQASQCLPIVEGPENAPANNAKSVAAEASIITISRRSSLDSVQQVAATSSESALRVTARIPGYCPPRCNCACHTKNAIWTPSWSAKIVGSFFLAYDTEPEWRGPKCTNGACVRSRSSASITYTFPQWLRMQAVSIRADFANAIRPQTSLHLPVQVVVSDWFLTHILSAGTLEEVQEYFEGLHRPYLPWDIISGDAEIMLWLRFVDRPDIVSYLSVFWAPILDRIRPPSQVIYTARDFSSHFHVDPVLRVMYENIASQDDDNVETEFPIHDAIRQCGNIEKAISDNLWALNTYDDFGQTPLHLAINTEHDNHVTLQALIKHGADLNQRHISRAALPISLAANRDCARCMELLLDGGCRQPTDTTIIEAALANPRQETIEIIRLVLLRMPALSRCNMNGVWQSLATAEMKQHVTEITKLLLDAGIPRQKADFFPLITALEYNNMELLHPLLEPDRATNMLHGFKKWVTLSCVACFSNLEVLNYLCSKNLVDCNLDETGFELKLTPWDEFLHTIFYPGRRYPVPSLPIIEAFVEFISGIKVRILSREIEILHSVMAAIDGRDKSAVAGLLKPLEEQKMAWNRAQELETLRVLRLQVSQGMWKAAEDTVRERIELLQQRRSLSPWASWSRVYLLEGWAKCNCCGRMWHKTSRRWGTLYSQPPWRMNHEYDTQEGNDNNNTQQQPGGATSDEIKTSSSDNRMGPVDSRDGGAQPSGVADSNSGPERARNKHDSEREHEISGYDDDTDKDNSDQVEEYEEDNEEENINNAIDTLFPANPNMDENERSQRREWYRGKFRDMSTCPPCMEEIHGVRIEYDCYSISEYRAYTNGEQWWWPLRR